MFSGFFAIVALFALGCESSDKHMSGSSNKPMMMSADACSKCPGVQHMTASGKCDGCGAQLVDACPHCPGMQAMTAAGKCEACGMAVADACPHCPGTQLATADGKCPMCGMSVTKQ